MKIAICDDEQVQVDYVKELIARWSSEGSYPCYVEGIYSSEEFLFKYESGNPFDLLILDIQMKAINGIELAKKVRSIDQNVKILFLTGIKDYVFDGYEVGAVRYIMKPLDEKAFLQLLDNFREEIKNRSDNYFIFSYMGENIKLAYSDIIKIEVDGHYLNMLTVNSEYRWKASLQSMLKKLTDKNFVLANRSSLINVLHIEKITKTDCTLSGNIVVPISKRNYKEVNQAFINYYI